MAMQRELPKDQTTATQRNQQMDQPRDLLWDRMTESQTEPTKGSRSLPLSASPMEPQKERRWDTLKERYSATSKETRWVPM